MNAVAYEPWALAVLRGALADFYIHDRALLALRAGETAVTFRLGHHLTLRAGAEWDVDAEYDREGEGGARKVRDELTGTRMRPDLVVHRRGHRGRSSNLLFLEVKRTWRHGIGDLNDLDKVGTAVTRHEYQFGVVLGMSRRGAPGRFSPTWTVHAPPLEEPNRHTVAKTALMAQAEAVFDDAALGQLEVAAKYRTGVPM